MNIEKFTAIVPVYNEEQSISHVLKTLLSFPLIDEVICINDGSSDASVTEISKFRNQIKFINVLENKGKGNAMVEGILAAKNGLLLFIDADLAGLSFDHLYLLTMPIFYENLDYVIGTISATSPFNSISGQRAYKKKYLLPLLDQLRPSRYGAEVILNELNTGLKGRFAEFPELNHLSKFQKRTPDLIVKEFIQEAVELLAQLNKTEKFPAIKKALSEFEEKVRKFQI